jgi:hypothetical protein
LTALDSSVVQTLQTAECICLATHAIGMTYRHCVAHDLGGQAKVTVAALMSGGDDRAAGAAVRTAIPMTCCARVVTGQDTIVLATHKEGLCC